MFSHFPKDKVQPLYPSLGDQSGLLSVFLWGLISLHSPPWQRALGTLDSPLSFSCEDQCLPQVIPGVHLLAGALFHITSCHASPFTRLSKIYFLGFQLHPCLLRLQVGKKGLPLFSQTALSYLWQHFSHFLGMDWVLQAWKRPTGLASGSLFKHKSLILAPVTSLKSEVTQSCPTLCNPMDCSLPGSSVHGIIQARILEWVPFSRGSAQPRDQTQKSHIAGRFFTFWATRKPSAPNKCMLNTWWTEWQWKLAVQLIQHKHKTNLKKKWSDWQFFSQKIWRN